MFVDFDKEVGSTLVKPKSHLLETNPTFEGDPYYGDYEDQININIDLFDKNNKKLQVIRNDYFLNF